MNIINTCLDHTLAETCSAYSKSTDGSLGPPGNPSASSAASSAPVSYASASSPATAGSASGTAGESIGTAGTSSATMTSTRRLRADAVGLQRWGAPSESSPSPLPRPLAATLPNARPNPPLVLTMICKCLPPIPSLNHTISKGILHFPFSRRN